MADKPLDHLSKYWTIYAFVLQAVVFGTLQYANIQSQDKRVSALEMSQTIQDARMVKMDETSSEIKTRLASIDTSLIFIKSALNIK